MRKSARPFVVGLGGTTRPGSSSERLARLALSLAEAMGAETQHFNAEALSLPIYVPEVRERTGAARAFVDAVRRADGLIVVSPGYHGGISGLIKNAIDYLEDLRDDERPYLEGRAVGCVVAASGWQATTTTLTALRSIVHALRGWPTPLGVAANQSLPLWTDDGELADRELRAQIEIVARQVVDFAHAQIAARAPA